VLRSFRLAANELKVNGVEIEERNIKHNSSEKTEGEDLPRNAAECKERMMETNEAIKLGAQTFLKKEYTFLCLFATAFAVLIYFAVDRTAGYSFPYTTLAFLIGAFTSMIAGFTGMSIATTANVKTTYLCNGCAEDNWDGEKALAAGFKVAFQGGQVLGFCLVGLALILLEIIILTYKDSILGTTPIS